MYDSCTVAYMVNELRLENPVLNPPPPLPKIYNPTPTGFCSWKRRSIYRVSTSLRALPGFRKWVNVSPRQANVNRMWVSTAANFRQMFVDLQIYLNIATTFSYRKYSWPSQIYLDMKNTVIQYKYSQLSQRYSAIANIVTIASTVKYRKCYLLSEVKSQTGNTVSYRKYS